VEKQRLSRVFEIFIGKQSIQEEGKDQNLDDSR
jgi:hypothetical protein